MGKQGKVPTKNLLNQENLQAESEYQRLQKQREEENKVKEGAIVFCDRQNKWFRVENFQDVNEIFTIVGKSFREDGIYLSEETQNVQFSKQKCKVTYGNLLDTCSMKLSRNETSFMLNELNLCHT